jgi:hypothetical protein
MRSANAARVSRLLACSIAAVVFAGCGTDDLAGDGRTEATCPEFMGMETSKQDEIGKELLEASGQSEPTSFSIGLVRTSLQAFCSNLSNEGANVGDLVLPPEALPGGAN